MQILVVDIGGTWIKYACMTENMDILNRGKVKTPQSGREELIETIGKIWIQIPEAEGIAISMPGIIDSENGYCFMGGALRYNDDFYLRHSLYERCPVRIVMENDAKCAAMAEAAVGSLKDVEDGFVLIFGTMIGGAFIKNHRLHRGRHFAAERFLISIPEERKCRRFPMCGEIAAVLRDCVECTRRRRGLHLKA